MPKVLIDIRIDDDALARLRGMPDVNVDIIEDAEEEDCRKLPTEQLRDVDILACTFPPTNIEDLENIGLIQIASAGYTQLIGKGLPERGVRAAALGFLTSPSQNGTWQ